jgi:hypothetical protein
MLTIIVKVDAPDNQALGIKEDLCNYLEQFGDVRFADVLVNDRGIINETRNRNRWNVSTLQG